MTSTETQKPLFCGVITRYFGLNKVNFPTEVSLRNRYRTKIGEKRL